MDGTLDATLVNGFTPAQYDSFDAVPGSDHSFSRYLDLGLSGFGVKSLICQLVLSGHFQLACGISGPGACVASLVSSRR